MRSKMGNGSASNFFNELANDYGYIVQALEHEDSMFEFELLRHLEVTRVLVHKLRGIQPQEITISKEPFRSSRANVQIRDEQMTGSAVDFWLLQESNRISSSTARVSWPCVSVTIGFLTRSNPEIRAVVLNNQ